MLHSTHMLCCVGEQRHIACLLDSSAQTTLMFGAGTRLTAGLDLASIGDVALHEAAGIFIIDFTNMIVTELTNFAAGRTLTASAFTTLAPLAAFTASLHRVTPSI